MPHVADGDMHAYLDGALGVYPQEEADRIREHLQSCSVCSERLEVEREVRNRADQILARSGPESLEAPPFEELLAHAGKLEPTTRKPGRWSLSPGLAWAATLLLAMAVGWAGRGILVPPDTRELVPDEVPAEAAGDATRPVSQIQPTADGGTPVAAVRERAPSPVTSTENEESPLDRVSGSEPVEVGDDNRQAQRQPVDASSIRAELAAPAGEREGAAPLPARALAESREPPSESVELDELARGDQETRLGAAGFADAVESGEASDLEARVTELTNESGGRLTVPGLDVISLGPAPPPNPQGSVLVVQRLPGGERLELLHGTGLPPDRLAQDSDRAEQSADSVQETPPEPQKVVATWLGGWSAAIGPLPPDSLRALLRALR